MMQPTFALHTSAILFANLGLATATPAAQAEPAGELLEVTRVVDGDTMHVMRDGRTEKLRLLSVDTEEKFSGGGSSSASKPQTIYGEETAIWAREFFDSLANEDGPARVSLRFPKEREERDIYGRLLCHLILQDGTDFNLLLVRQGRSPYFNKYGNSLISHDAFVAAQKAAREAQLGVWNPATNRPLKEGAPAAQRPYEQLLPWWECRAEAIDGFRALAAEDPDSVVAADDPEALQRALDSKVREVRVFGSPSEFFEEQDGSLTLLFRGADRRRSLRVKIAAEHRDAHAALKLTELALEYHQNYVYVKGRLAKGDRGFEIWSLAPEQWERAGPEPTPLTR